MIFSYNWLQDYIKGKLPEPKKFAELFMAKSFEVEGIEKIGGDFALDIDIKPNRAPDCLSHLGIARECAAVFNDELKEPEFNPRRQKDVKSSDFIKVKVEDKKYCPRYTAKVVDNIKVGPSPNWIKKRLEVCGLQPINNIVDIVNYVMLETGQPLHAFDLDKIEGKKLIVRFAKKGEKITTLDEQNFDLKENILVIADSKKPVAIAGLKGGKETGIDKETKTVVLEAANFDRVTIRKGSQILKLRTDASWRFENGLDPNLTEKAINRTSALLEELASGKAAEDVVDFYPEKIKSKTALVSMEHIENLLGVKIPKKDILKYLKSLGFKILKNSVKGILVKVPTFRLDVSLPEDLIEEVGRLYGYEKIPTIAPKASLIPPKKNIKVFWEEFSKDVLKEAGFSEVYNYSFINPKQADMFGFTKDKLIGIENPLSENQAFLSPSLLCNLLQNVVQNLRYFDNIEIFELGKVFFRDKTETEKRMLTAAVVSRDASAEILFYQLKGVVDLLLQKLGISGAWYDAFQPTPEKSNIKMWHPTRRSEIKVGNKEIGFLGQISFKLKSEMKLDANIVLFDIDFEKLQKLSSEEHEYQVISPYPSAVRDIALLVPQDVLAEEALNKINTAGGKIVRDVDLFDIYQGKSLPDNKKNLAFHIVYQAADRTLSSEEIDDLHQKIINTLELNPEWEVRK